jgi:hypothetical protein
MAERKDIIALVQEWLQPYFSNKLPSNFGRPTLRMVQEGLRTAGIGEVGVAGEILGLGAKQMVGYLQRGGTAPFPESLLQVTCCEILRTVLKERAGDEITEIMRLLWGEVALGTSRLRDEAAVLGRVREAIEQLSEPFKSFMRLDFIEGRSEEEIRLKLGLADHEEYLHLKRLSFSALRQAIERLLSSKPLRVVT